MERDGGGRQGATTRRASSSLRTAADALDGGADGDDAAIAAGETAFPLAKIKRIVKLDPDVKNITKEATALIAKADGALRRGPRRRDDAHDARGRRQGEPQAHQAVGRRARHRAQAAARVAARGLCRPTTRSPPSGRGDARPRITEADAAGSRRIDQMFQPKTALLKAAAAATDADARARAGRRGGRRRGRRRRPGGTGDDAEDEDEDDEDEGEDEDENDGDRGRHLAPRRAQGTRDWLHPTGRARPRALRARCPPSLVGGVPKFGLRVL